MKQFQYILYIIAEISSKMDKPYFDAEKIIHVRCEEYGIRDSENDLINLVKKYL